MQAQEDRRSMMLDLARRWRDSGVKARAFAQEHGVTRSSPILPVKA